MRKGYASLLLLALAAFCRLAPGQVQPSPDCNGSVRDASGGAAAKADLALQGNGNRYSAVSTESGSFHFAAPAKAGQITGGFGTDMLMTNRSHSTCHALQSSVYSGVQQTGAGSLGADRPDQIGTPDLSTGRSIQEDYFGLGAANASYFVIPINAPGGTGPNSGVSGTLIKDTTGEAGASHRSMNLQFPAEFFNLLNIANFDLPSNILTGSGFGIIEEFS